MNQPHRYTLEPYKGPKSRTTCPECQHRNKTFKRYIDTQTGDYLADNVGRCDREDQCGYHYSPKEFFKVNPEVISKRISKPVWQRCIKPQFDTVPAHYISDSQRVLRSNNFLYFLGKMFGVDKARELAVKYNIGTANKWPGATIFWQVDTMGKVRTGKIMLYDMHTCKRVKEPFNHIAWVHNILSRKYKVLSHKSISTTDFGLKTPDFLLKQCLFGEHLLAAEPHKPVAIVESEKTAIIASMYLPQYIWLAAGSLEGLNADKCRVLANRQVMLFPDVKGYNRWLDKAHELNYRIPTATFSVSDQLERTADAYDRQRGIDIADLWIEALLREWGLLRDGD
jgi:uncharacterized protein DUF6371/zinc ribbon protein